MCRVESSSAGEQSARLGPLSIVRERTSPAALHGFCLGDLPDFVAEIEQAGPLANEHQRQIADAARTAGADPSYRDCPSWRAEYDNRRAAKLVDLPGERREYRAA